MKKSLLAALLALSVTVPALAFTRSRDAQNGVCTYWKDFSMNWVLNQACSADLALENCVNAIRAAFETWNQVECSPFVFNYDGLTERTDVGFDQQHWNQNINLVIFREEDWSHGAAAIAMTTTTYDIESGELVDADLELNGKNFIFDTQPSPRPGHTDLQNTVTHEAGHMLGLDHSLDPQATMFATAPPGDIEKRTLDKDDIDGICFVYPMSGKIPMYTDPTMTTVCGKDSDQGCCSTAGGARGGPALLLLLLLFRRRKR